MCLFDIKDFIECCGENFFYEDYFVGVDVALTAFDFCDGASCYIAAAELHFCRESILCYAASLAQSADISADFLFCFKIHILHRSLHLFGNKHLDIIIKR